jgi:hypothetical protein
VKCPTENIGDAETNRNVAQEQDVEKISELSILLPALLVLLGHHFSIIQTGRAEIPARSA